MVPYVDIYHGGKEHDIEFNGDVIISESPNGGNKLIVAQEELSKLRRLGIRAPFTLKVLKPDIYGVVIRLQGPEESKQETVVRDGYLSNVSISKVDKY